MFEVKEYNDKFGIYELVESSTNSWVKVCPDRGGIVLSYGANGNELLYLDKDTFHDEKANIRGGIPILFPICGQLENGAYKLEDKVYHMKNHGVARTSQWEVMETIAVKQASITLRLASNEETKKSYPFEFELIFTYILKDGRLTINQQYTNKSSTLMPLQAGFHPYFKALEKNISYETDASTYLDYNDMKIKSYEGSIDLTNLSESVAFTDANSSEINFKLPELKRKICLKYGKEFKFIVLWSVKDKDFICVEPWTAKNGALNTGEGVMFLKEGESLNTFFSIEASLEN